MASSKLNCLFCQGSHSGPCPKFAGKYPCEYCLEAGKKHDPDCQACIGKCVKQDLRYVIGGVYCTQTCAKCDHYRKTPSTFQLTTQAEREQYLIDCGLQKPSTAQIQDKCLADKTLFSHCEQAGVSMCMKCLALFC